MAIKTKQENIILNPALVTAFPAISTKVEPQLYKIIGAVIKAKVALTGQGKDNRLV